MAAECSRPEMVSLLLTNCADVRATTGCKNSVLALACCNGAFGCDIVPLVGAFGRVENPDQALWLASASGFAMVECLVLVLPAGTATAVMNCAPGDFVGAFKAALSRPQYFRHPSSGLRDDFGFFELEFDLWAKLRWSDCWRDEDSVTGVLKSSQGGRV